MVNKNAETDPLPSDVQSGLHLLVPMLGELYIIFGHGTSFLTHDKKKNTLTCTGKEKIYLFYSIQSSRDKEKDLYR